MRVKSTLVISVRVLHTTDNWNKCTTMCTGDVGADGARQFAINSWRAMSVHTRREDDRRRRWKAVVTAAVKHGRPTAAAAASNPREQQPAHGFVQSHNFCSPLQQPIVLVSVDFTSQWCAPDSARNILVANLISNTFRLISLCKN